MRPVIEQNRQTRTQSEPQDRPGENALVRGVYPHPSLISDHLLMTVSDDGLIDWASSTGPDRPVLSGWHGGIRTHIPRALNALPHHLGYVPLRPATGR